MFDNNFKRNLSTLFILLLVRLLSVFLIQTSFVPDEYWQSLEVAHRMTFSYGYLTWEWKKKIRSSVYPFMFHLMYSIFPESVETLILLPKIFQAILSAVGDFFTYKLASKLFGGRCGKWTMFNILTSWFSVYCASRTITNMAEASFTACGFYFYPWYKEKSKGLTSDYLWFAGASVLMRPTAVVTWLPLYLYHISREKSYYHIIRNTFVIGVICLAILMTCDRCFYGDWVLTPYNFFFFNWTNDIGAFYGQHNFLWYFYVGIPVVLGIHLIPFVAGFAIPQLRPFYCLILWVIFVFSVPSHKEFRFMLPILPLCLIICSAVMNEIAIKRLVLFGYKLHEKVNAYLICAILLVHIPLSLYMGLFHQRGVVDAALYLSHSVNKDSSVLFLMPCHSTPYYSYIHQNIPMKFLSCEPNFDKVANYAEEADVFFQNPSSWLAQSFSNSKTHKPSHIVMYDSLYHHVSQFLKKYEYYLCYKAFHSHFSEQRTGKFVHIYCRQ